MKSLTRLCMVSRPISLPIRFYSTRLYTKDHEWVLVDNNGMGTIGITDYAQKALGDVVFIELPTVGAQLEKKDTLGAVESVKAASDVYAPVSGKVVEINSQLESEPSLINTSPFENGWISKIQLSDAKQIEELLKEKDYKDYIQDL